MNFEAIRNTLENHIQEMSLPYTREMWVSIENLDIDRLNAEIIRVHEAEAAEWERCLDTKPHTPEWSTNVYGWVIEANEFLASEPPVFTIPASWGVNALQLWSRWQAHCARIARAA